MRNFLAAMVVLVSAAAPMAAYAQGANGYDCVDEPTRVNIPSMPLGEAVVRFTDLTGCPVSLDADEVANTDVSELPTYAVKGRMTPSRALRTMLSSSPLKSRMIRGGFSVYQN